MFKVTVKKFGFTTEQEKKIDAAAKLMEVVWNSKEFKDAVINFKYSYSYVTGKLWCKKTNYVSGNRFRWNNNMSNELIYSKLLSGSESLSPQNDGEADIEIVLTTDISDGVIGYTYPDTIRQWISRDFFLEFDKFDVLNNLTHEYCHKLGFDHEFEWTLGS